SDSSAPGSLPPEGASFLSATPAQWSVEEVCRFISSLQGCEELAAQFLSQEIDGQALLLLREDHLISTMNIKLGPALKICKLQSQNLDFRNLNCVISASSF
uniref:SAM domain-containing protein n=1 Tax=Acanthochromis polyacanthus TaxID=80966 RepID=A0A3Q1FN51_9TELE